MFNLNALRYITDECIRQNFYKDATTAMKSVYDMANAWDHADWYSDSANERQVTLDFIENLGRLVEPKHNSNGFRTVAVFVGDSEKAPWDRVPELLTRLIEAYYAGHLEWHFKEHRPANPKAKTAEDQFYFEYENIHPFVDGNGRTGKILYNYLLGKLDDPILPPNFWNVVNL